MNTDSLDNPARRRLPSLAALLLCALLVLASARPGHAGDPFDAINGNDPIEPVNRVVFAINDAVDTMILWPAATLYRDLVPTPIQNGVRNLLRWLRSPVILVNTLLQGDMEAAGTTAARFFINLPTLGTVDLALDMGFRYRDEDFGQTLGSHGAGGGPYLVLPLFGPSNARDAFGKVVDGLVDPLTYVGSDGFRATMGVSRGTAGAVDFRARNMDLIDDLKVGSLDQYAAVRTMYWQRRIAAIYNGVPPAGASHPDLPDGYDPFAPGPGLDGQTGDKPR